MLTRARNYATGVWNSGFARAKAEGELIRDGLSFKNSDDYKLASLSLADLVKSNSITESRRIEIDPSIMNSMTASFTSKGAGKAAGLGALAGAGYGLYSEDSGMIGGAIKGAGLGYALKGLQGSLGERKRLLGESNTTIFNAYQSAINSIGSP